MQTMLEGGGRQTGRADISICPSITPFTVHTVKFRYVYRMTQDNTVCYLCYEGVSCRQCFLPSTPHPVVLCEVGCVGQVVAKSRLAAASTDDWEIGA